MKILIALVVSSMQLQGCSSVSAIATVASYDSVSCTNPLSPVLCGAETAAVVFAQAYGCTAREQRKRVNGCEPGREYRVFPQE